MRKARFSMNALLVIVAIFSAIELFSTVWVYDNAKYTVYLSDYYRIEDTDLWVRYATKEPSGIYRGTTKLYSELLIEGEFGYDWGAAVCGGQLYINKYRTTDLGLTLCDVVRIDMETAELEMFMEDTVIRGKCASGELVCIGGAMLPVDSPATNPLCDLYCAVDPDIRADAGEAVVMLVDPESGEVVWSGGDSLALTEGSEAKTFRTRYLDRTLAEIAESGD